MVTGNVAGVTMGNELTLTEMIQNLSGRFRELGNLEARLEKSRGNYHDVGERLVKYLFGPSFFGDPNLLGLYALLVSEFPPKAREKIVSGITYRWGLCCSPSYFESEMHQGLILGEEKVAKYGFMVTREKQEGKLSLYVFGYHMEFDPRKPIEHQVTKEAMTFCNPEPFPQRPNDRLVNEVREAMVKGSCGSDLSSWKGFFSLPIPDLFRTPEPEPDHSHYNPLFMVFYRGVKYATKVALGEANRRVSTRKRLTEMLDAESLEARSTLERMRALVGPAP